MVMTVHASVCADQSVETPYPDSPWVVMKFGGRSVATAENWAKIAELVRARVAEGVVPVIVHSALAGVSNGLIDLLDTAERGDAVEEKLAALKRQHLDLAADLGVDGSSLGDLFEKVVRAQHSQSNEREADDYAMAFMKAKRYDSKACVSALEKLAAMSGGDSTSFLSTHPSPKERADRMKTQVA